MARPKKKTVASPPLITIHKDVREPLETWLGDEITKCIKKRDEIKPKVEKWRMTLNGERPTAPLRTGASNLSVPFTSWVYSGMRARLNQGVLGATQLLAVEPLTSAGEKYGGKESCLTIAKSLTRLLTAEFKNRRGLNAEAEMEKVIAEATQIGTSAWKVYPTADVPKRLPPLRPGGSPRTEVILGRAVWEYISYFDLVYWDGYGTNTQAMPFVGNQFRKPWHEIVSWADERIGYYYPGIDKELVDFYAKDQGSMPAHMREHDVVELYLDFDVDGDKYLEPVIIDWHLDARKIMRCTWNWSPTGHRPIFMAQYDLSPDPNCGLGQGVCAKLEGAQEEVDAIHNIGIEAGKRGIAHVVALRANSQAAQEFGGNNPVIPGDTIVTENVEEDIKTHPLGDPRAAEAAIVLEEHTRQYITRIFGFDDSASGNLESGKRVPGGLGMTIKREGRVATEAALDSFAASMEDATYVTVDLWKQKLPAEAFMSVLSQDEIAALMRSVFSVSDASVRDSFVIKVNARDAALAEEEKKQELFALNQFLFGFYDRLNQLALAAANPQLPPAAKQALVIVAERMERGVEALLTSINSIPNPAELLVSVTAFTDEIKKAIETTPTMIPVGPEAGDSTTGDLGGGVA
jgi:hypothetical protein